MNLTAVLKCSSKLCGFLFGKLQLNSNNASLSDYEMIIHIEVRKLCISLQFYLHFPCIISNQRLALLQDTWWRNGHCCKKWTPRWWKSEFCQQKVQLDHWNIQEAEMMCTALISIWFIFVCMNVGWSTEPSRISSRYQADRSQIISLIASQLESPRWKASTLALWYS